MCICDWVESASSVEGMRCSRCVTMLHTTIQTRRLWMCDRCHRQNPVYCALPTWNRLWSAWASVLIDKRILHDSMPSAYFVDETLRMGSLYFCSKATPPLVSLCLWWDIVYSRVSLDVSLVEPKHLRGTKELSNVSCMVSRISIVTECILPPNVHAC